MLAESLNQSAIYGINALFLGFLPVFVAFCFSWILSVFIRTPGNERNHHELPGPPRDSTYTSSRLSFEDRLLIAIFCTLGAMIGIWTGSSRESIVAASLPVVVSIISTYLAYLFTAGQDTVRHAVIPFCIIFLIFGASFGAFYGASIRASAEADARAWEKELIRWQELEVPLNKEFLRSRMPTQ